MQSLDRALDILEALAASKGDVGVTELSDRVSLHVSTVHRLLSVLVSRGYARQNAPAGRYSLGPGLLKLAHNAVGTGQFDLRDEARPVLEALAHLTGETTNLVTLLDSQAVYVDQVASRHMVRMFTQIGTRAPLYCTGAGKVLLACQSATAIEAYLAREPLEPRTPHTHISRAALRVELARVRERGYALDEGELDAEVRCVAAPVFDHTGSAVAAVSVSGPASRFTPAKVRAAAQALVRATHELSERLGYHGGEAGAS